MSRGILVWSFASLPNMDQAINAIRSRWPSPTTIVRGQIDGNLYWQGEESDAEYVAGLCRGVAYVLGDGSIG